MRSLAVCIFVCLSIGFQRLEIGAGDRNVLFHGTRPSYRVLEDLLDIFVLIRGIALVTGLEIEDLSVTARPGASAAEDLAALEPTEENDLLGIIDSTVVNRVFIPCL